MKSIISKNIKVRVPEYFKIHKNSVIDDYCYFSTKIEIGMFCHIANGCSIAGGKEYLFKMGNFGSLSSGVKIWCSSNDFKNDLIIITKGLNLGDKPASGNVIIGNYCGVGSNSVIMPKNKIPDGVAIGALSFVPSNFKFKAWSVYAGIPIKRIGKRNRVNVEKQLKKIHLGEVI